MLVDHPVFLNRVAFIFITLIVENLVVVLEFGIDPRRFGFLFKGELIGQFQTILFRMFV
jgi:hypothetical protein